MVYTVSVFVFVFFCIVFRFPVVDDDLLCLCPEVDRLSDTERLIELGDIVTSDILFATRQEMSLHHIGERVYQYVEWLPIIIVVSLFVWFDGLLKCVDDLSWLARIAEDERLIAEEFHHYI